MADLMTWDPFREFAPLRQMMDRLIEDAWVRTGAMWSMEGYGPFPCDIYETDDEYVVSAALPGLKPEDVEVTVEGNTVTISGEIKPEAPEREPRYYLHERRHGRFSRRITLPAGIEADKVRAVLEHGVLTLHVPKAEALRPRRIPIQAGPVAAQIKAEERAAA